MLSPAPEPQLREMVSARQWILDSRLGACWKCMTFTAVMLVISAGAFVMTLRWQELEGMDSEILAGLAVGVTFFSTVGFALLAVAHVVCLVLRKSIWRR